MRQITRCIRRHTMESVLKPSKPRRGLIGNGNSIVTCHGFHRNCMSFLMKNSRIAFQITLISALLVWQKCKIWFYRSVISTSKGYLHRKNMPRIATLSVYLLVLKRVRRDIRDSRNGGHCQIVCWQSEADCAESNRTKCVKYVWLSYPTWPSRWMLCISMQRLRLKGCHVASDEWTSGEICSLQHMWVIGSVMWAAASGESLKFGVQGATGTNWFQRVNGARDNGVWLYFHISKRMY